MTRKQFANKFRARRAKIGAMVLCHRRPWLLPLIARQCRTIWPDSIVQFTLDRPSAEVIEAAQEARRWHENLEIFEAPFPPIGEKENWMALRNWQLEQMEPRGPEFCMIWDDDHIFERPMDADVYMKAGYDLVYTRKLFFWNQTNMVNIGLFEHNSVSFFRLIKGDRFPLDRIIHAPAGIHDNPLAKKAQMNSRLLDVGYLYPEDRERVFNMYAKAGKLDAATMPLMEEPILEQYKAGQSREPGWYGAMRDTMKKVQRERPTRKSA